MTSNGLGLVDTGGEQLYPPAGDVCFFFGGGGSHYRMAEVLSLKELVALNHIWTFLICVYKHVYVCILYIPGDSK